MNPTEPSIPAIPSPKYATRREIARSLELIGGKQKQLIRLEQVTEAGLSERAVTDRVGARTLFRIHDGVFALHPPPYSLHQLYLAAVYAGGPRSFISDLPAAWLLGMREEAPRIPHVSSRAARGRSRRGIVVHQRTVARRDVFERYAIPCTRPERTILDCAASVSIRELEELLMAADSKKPRLDRRRLETLVAQSSGRRGIRNLRELISDDPKDTEAENERRMLRICRRLGIPDPETQYEIKTTDRTFRADFYWPELRLVVEADSWRWHGGKLKSEEDTGRDQLLAIAGWLVVHFTRKQIKLDPGETGRRLVALVEARRRGAAA